MCPHQPFPEGHPEDFVDFLNFTSRPCSFHEYNQATGLSRRSELCASATAGPVELKKLSPPSDAAKVKLHVWMDEEGEWKLERSSDDCARSAIRSKGAIVALGISLFVFNLWFGQALLQCLDLLSD